MHSEAPKDSISVDLAGRRALITGGSRGIAAAIARSMARCGAAVALNHCAHADTRAGHPQAAEALVTELRALGAKALALEADLAQPGVAVDLADRAVAALGGIDILVLSASVQVHRDILAQTEAEMALQFQVNLVANIQLLQRLLPPMRDVGWGRVVTIGSVQEDTPSPEVPVYSMTKAAQVNLVRNLALQNAAFGVTVNNVAPGLVQTDRNAFRRREPGVWEDFAAGANPMGRAGQPDEIVGAVLFLASDAASFVTGTTIHATGGSHIPWVRRPKRGPTGQAGGTP